MSESSSFSRSTRSRRRVVSSGSESSTNSRQTADLGASQNIRPRHITEQTKQAAGKLSRVEEKYFFGS